MGDYVYIQTEDELWTVGFYAPNGQFSPSADFHSEEEAGKHVHYLNGGAEAIKTTAQVDQHVAELQRRIDELQHQLDAINHPARTQAPMSSWITLPSGNHLNLGLVSCTSVRKSSLVAYFIGGGEGNDVFITGDDYTALINYLNRFAPYIQLSGLTASEQIADDDAEELRR